MIELAVLTNALAADQRSMIGYGELLLQVAARTNGRIGEFRAASWLSRFAPGRVGGRPLAKLLANLDRFVASPLKLAGRGAEIVHVVDPGNILYLNIIRHRVSIVTVHDVIPYLCLAGKLEGFRPTRLGERLMDTILTRLQRVDRIVCVSENTRHDLLGLVDLAPERVVTIPNAVFQPMRRADEADCAALRARLNLPAQAPIVLHVGSDSFYKNRRTVLDVFARIGSNRPDAILLFVGPLSADLADRITELGLGHCVHFADRIGQADMAAVYSASSVLLFPSLYEGFGYPVLEAQLCGTPVVCSNAGSLPEVAGRAASLHAPRDVPALAASALHVLNDPEAESSLRKAGHENAKRFSLQRWHSAHIHLYDTLKSAESAGRLVHGS